MVGWGGVEPPMVQMCRIYSPEPDIYRYWRPTRFWWIRRGLNPRPRNYEFPALTTELRIHFQRTRLFIRYRKPV